MKTVTVDSVLCSVNICGWMMRLVLVLVVTPVSALDAETRDSIRLNPKFMEELNRAFSLDPVEAPIVVPDDVLTREQLHEWVGPVEDEAGARRSGKYDPTDPNRFDSTYFALKMYLVEFCKWQPAVNEISIPGLQCLTDGLQHYGKYAHSTPTGGIGATIDVNALSKYVRPSEIRLRKSRALADKSRATMDKFFPLDGEPIYSAPDTMTLNARQSH